MKQFGCFLKYCTDSSTSCLSFISVSTDIFYDVTYQINLHFPNSYVWFPSGSQMLVLDILLACSIVMRYHY